jgi:hypothetical protein
MADEQNLTPAADTAAATGAAAAAPSNPLTDAGKPGGDGTAAAVAAAGVSSEAAAAAGTGDKAGGDNATATTGGEYAAFKVPDGFEFDAAQLTEMTALFKKHGLSQEAAQDLINTEVAKAQAADTQRTEAFNQLTKDWLEASKVDKEIGGEAFTQNIAHARLALTQFGTPELNELLSGYGIGNHPEVIRVFTRIGKLLKEDQPGKIGSAPQVKKDRVDILYGETTS